MVDKKKKITHKTKNWSRKVLNLFMNTLSKTYYVFFAILVEGFKGTDETQLAKNGKESHICIRK